MKTIFFVILFAGLNTYASCELKYEEQLSYFSGATFEDSFEDSAEFLNSLLSNIPNKIDSKIQDDILNPFVSTTGVAMTTTLGVPALTTSPIATTTNALDPQSRYNETKLVYKIISELGYRSQGGLTGMQLYVRLKEAGYNKTFKEMISKVSEMNTSQELCRGTRDYVMPLSEVISILLAS